MPGVSSKQQQPMAEWDAKLFAGWHRIPEFLDAVRAKIEMRTSSRKSQEKENISVIIVHNKHVPIAFGKPYKWERGVAQKVLGGVYALAIAEVSRTGKKDIKRVTDLKSVELTKLISGYSPRDATELVASILQGSSSVESEPAGATVSTVSTVSTGVADGGLAPLRLAPLGFRRPDQHAGECCSAENHGCVGWWCSADSAVPPVRLRRGAG
eukprot:CAMPEP_0177691854 /NCGR_PEP_ID=MMETSP0484_2-20121128/1535_1 /TAXON_ID=354590 /ORGANISM="Rhodomonas lens, Strain RHODO" /LENGTH=210 /DNA_ID=CAMNT_0019202519 /DNA_START=105 /DNA_END=733 /DNA_ORIENTATION=-